MPWCAKDYLSSLPSRPNGFHGSVEEAIEINFPPAEKKPFPTLSKPAIIVDKNGIILVWYLPEALGQNRQVSCLSYQLK